MKRIFLLFSLLALSALALTACGGGEENTEETATLRLSEVTHSVFYAPQYVALTQGFFAEEGLEIELSNGGGADKVMTAVLSGDADVGLAGPEACIYVHLEGREDAPKIFAQLTHCDGSFLVGRTPEENFSWDDLRGKTVIGGRKGGVPEMTLEYVMKQHGVIPNEDAAVDTSVQFNMMAGAFTGGAGDYVTLFEPTASEVERNGKGYILCSLGEESGEIPYTAYFAAESFLTEKPDLARRFVRAMTKALRYVETHTDEEVAEAIASEFPDTDLSLLAATVARHRSIGCWGSDGVMTEDALHNLEAVMESAGELKARVPFADLVDNTFAAEVK